MPLFVPPEPYSKKIQNYHSTHLNFPIQQTVNQRLVFNSPAVSLLFTELPVKKKR